VARKSRVAARKLKDKWKLKTWYNVIAPDVFDGAILGETAADDPAKLLDRVMEVTVQDLTGDFSKMHIKLQFKVHDVRGGDAYTRFVGHDMTSDYVRRQTRRNRSRVDAIVGGRTKDGYSIRLKVMAITDRRIQSSKSHAVRKQMEKVLRTAIARNTVGGLMKIVISGELSKRVAISCKPIQPIKRVEIRRSEVVGFPAESATPTEEAAEGGEPEAPPSEEEAPPEGGEADESPSEEETATEDEAAEEEEAAPEAPEPA
jgi:small subunit ribosomal protein S3Ae